MLGLRERQDVTYAMRFRTYDLSSSSCRLCSSAFLGCGQYCITGISSNISPTYDMAYFTTIFHTFLYRAEKSRVTMKATILILGVIRSCDTLIESPCMKVASLQLAPKS